MNNKNIHVICPECGTEFEIGDENTKVTPMHDIPDGVYTLIPKNDKRLNALKDLGIDISKFFGAEINISSENSENKSEMDDIESEIRSNGFIEGKSLWRRWVMAQMFRALNSYGGYDNYYNTCYDYNYSWKTLLDDLKAQTKIANPTEFEIRNRFFNKDVAYEMALHYISSLKKLLNHNDRRKCKGKEYIKINGSGNVFVEAVEEHLTKADRAAFIIKQANNIETVYKYTMAFYKDIVKVLELPRKTSKSRSWRNAFMGAGSYYTLENLIKFHNCKVHSTRYTREVYPFAADNGIYNVSESMNIIDNMSESYKDDYYKLFAFMKDVISTNNYDFKKDMENKYSA